MNTRTKIRKTRRGTALLATFGVVVLMAAVCSTMYGYSSQQLHSTVKTRDFLKAKAIAEAGINCTYNQLKHDFSKISDPALFEPAQFGGGSYDVDYQGVTNNKGRLVSVGLCGLSKATVKVDLLNMERVRVKMPGNEEPIDPDAFLNYAILTGGLIDWGGGGEVRGGGKIRTNNRIDMVGGGEFRGPGIKVYATQKIYVQGSSLILGEAHSPRFEGKTDQITALVTEAVPLFSIPKLDLAPFYQHALANNQVKTTTGAFLINSDYTPAGGVLWVNGDLKISNGKMNGCFIATGDIEISTSQNMIAVNGYPLLISRDGKIKVTSTPTMSGLIYARNGSIDWQGGGLLTGSILAWGELNKAGGSDLIIDFTPALPSIPGMMPITTNKTDYVIISAWQG